MMIDVLTAPVLSLFKPHTGVAHRTHNRPNSLVALWRSVIAERRRLATMDPRLLADIGIDPDGAAVEADRAFWDVTNRR